MTKHITKPTVITPVGNKPKLIEEFIGRINSQSSEVSVARMKSPAGWEEPGQSPQFNEYTVVLAGMLQVETRQETLQIRAGQAVIATKGEWIRYSSPEPGGAEYLAVCVPAFSPDTVQRDLDLVE